MKQELDKTEIETFFQQLISKETDIPLHEIDINVEFINFGIDSLQGYEILERIEIKFGIETNPMLFWDYPTISQLSSHIIERNLHPD